jgi:retinol dehydrogenase 12
VPTDLGDLSSVFRAVEHVRTLTRSIDIVFANAGVSKGQTPLSPDGLETVFAINHVGHHALITRLLPVLLQTGSKGADVRVVMTSSSVAWNVKKFDYADFFTPFIKGQGWETDSYDRSKLATLLFGMKLADHVRDRGCSSIYVNIADPGIIFGTGIHLQLDISHTLPIRILIAVMDWWYGLSIAEGALTSLFLGTSPVIAQSQINGKFYRPFGYLLPRNKYPKLATNELAEKLWDWTEDFVSMKETEIRLQSRGG